MIESCKQQIAYPWFFYTVPELVPSLLMIVMFPPRWTRNLESRADKATQRSRRTRSSAIVVVSPTSIAPPPPLPDQRTPLLASASAQHMYGHTPVQLGDTNANDTSGVVGGFV
jgi:hypothetical protein